MSKIYQPLADRSLQENWEIKYKVVFDGGPCLRMEGHENPWSIKEPEFEYLRDFIIENGLKSGFEVATAFGISSLAAGLGFLETEGKLITMDAYVEEQVNHWGGYRHINNQTYKDADGWKSAHKLFEVYGLESIVTPKIGWSPNDTAESIQSVTKEPLDYVFIDAAHFDENLIADIQAVEPFLKKDRFALFIHDAHAFSEAAITTVENILKQKVRRVPELVYPVGFNMAIASNL